MSVRQYRTIALAAVVPAILASAVWTQAAQPKPKAAGAAAEKPEGKAPAEPRVVEPEDPAVQALLETRPSTPSEWFQTARTLASLQKPALAKRFLQRILAAKLDRRELAALGEQFGSGALLDMASREELLPEGKQVADAVTDALVAQVRDPQRLARLVGQLQSPSAEARYQALVGLQEAQRAAVGPLVAVLADPRRAAEHPNVRAALARLDVDALRPLIAVLESPDPRLQVEAIGVLAEMGARGSVVFLLEPLASPQSPPEVRRAAEAAVLKLFGQLPSRTEAARMVARQAQQYFDGRQPLKEDIPGQVEVWSWDAAAKQPVGKSYASEEAVRVLAARLARHAHAIAPEDAAIRVLYVSTLLEQAAWDHGLDQALSAEPGTPADQAAAFGPEVLEAVLRRGIEGRHVPAATAAARLLGRVGKAERLLYQGAQPSPLVRAVRHPDARLRLAAIEAILALKPARPFPGATHVVEALGFFLSGDGSRRVLAADASTAEARRLGNYLAAMGFALDTAGTGREVLRMALTSPDYELILLDAGLDHPTVDFVVQQLRRDFRTGSIPVGIIAKAGQWERAARLAAGDPLTCAVPRLHAEEPVRREIERLLNLDGRKRVTQSERRRQAAQAMQWLVQLRAADSAAFDLAPLETPLLTALAVPELSAQAAGLLAKVGTPAGQQALVDLASRHSRPIELRRAAVEAFRRNVQEHRVLLTTSQILRQYERYNQSQNLDRATQEVLGRVLDIIEAPSKAARPARQADGTGAKEMVHPKPG